MKIILRPFLCFIGLFLLGWGVNGLGQINNLWATIAGALLIYIAGAIELE